MHNSTSTFWLFSHMHYFIKLEPYCIMTSIGHSIAEIHFPLI